MPVQLIAVAAVAMSAMGFQADPPTPTAAPKPPACEVTQAKHGRYVKAVYRERDKISKRARRRMNRLKTCAKSDEAAHNMRHLERQEARDRKERQDTPFRFALASYAERVEMIYYIRHPMPWCTWGPESGIGRPEWSMARYLQPNVSGGSGGGKFQILTSTWTAFGGFRYASGPVVARPVLQERVARKIARDGLHHWVNC